MKMQLLAAAIVVLATGAQAFGQSCGCDSGPVVTHHTQHGGCHHCCNSCHNPVLELVEGIGFTLKQGACHLRNGVHRLFHPITFHGCHRGCGCGVEPACGCGAPISSTYEYEHMMPGVEIIEEGPPAVPSIPAPPRSATEPTSTSEPARFQPPGKWQPAASQHGRTKVQLSSGRTSGSASARAATYYAPSRSK